LFDLPGRIGDATDGRLTRHGHPMPAMQEKTRLDRIVVQWGDLAERRLEYFTELYRSGRWRRYYSEDRFVVVMAEVAKTVSAWRELAGRTPAAGAGKDDRRPAA